MLKKYEKYLYIPLTAIIFAITLYIGQIIIQKQSTESSGADFVCACIVYDWASIKFFAMVYFVVMLIALLVRSRYYHNSIVKQ